MSVKDRQVVLISGASRGIGNTCATFLAKRGHAVYGTSLYPGSSPRMMDEFFELLPMDNCDETSVNAVISRIIEKEGHINLVVCNEGKTIYGAVENTPLLAASQQMEVNFMGTARLISAVLPIMRRNRSGTILVISSIVGRIGLPFNAYYSASKFALEGYVESLRLELAHSGVRIALIEPGSVRAGLDPDFSLFSGESGDGYTCDFAKVMQVLEARAKDGINPVVIARLVHRLMGRKRLRARYSIGLMHQRLAFRLKTWLPSMIYELILLKYFGISKNRKE